MRLTSIEPAELKGCACDGYGQLEEVLVERLRQVEMVCFDLDGTMLTSQKDISPRTMAAIHKALDAGIVMVPASGRVLSVLPHVLFGIPGMEHAVCAAGASVVRLGDHRRASAIIHETGMTPDYAAMICKGLLEEFGDDIFIMVGCGASTYSTREQIEVFESFEPDPGALDFIRSICLIMEDVVEGTRALAGPISRVDLFYRRPEVRGRLMRWLDEHVECETGNSLGDNVEINERGSSKWRGITWLCEHLGVRSDRVLCVGDGGNDVDMLRKSWVGVAMKNADAVAVDACDAQTRYTNDEDGVGRLLEELVVLKQGESAA